MALAGASILITGGCGQIGAAIINHLQERHRTSTIAVLDLEAPSAGDPRFIEKVAYYVGDVANEAAVRAVFNAVKPHVVFHTAGLIPSVAERLHVHSERYYYTVVNVEGTRNVLNAARDVGSVKAFVYTSSADVVKAHSWEDLVNVNESKSIPEKFDNPYAESKARAESLVLSASTLSLPTTALRPHAVFGGHDTNLLPLLLAAPRNFHLGPGSNLYDFTPATDLAIAHALAAANLLRTAPALPSNPASAAAKPFFVTAAEPLPFRAFCTALWAAYDPPQVPRVLPAGQLRCTVPLWLALCGIWLLEMVALVLRRRPVLTVRGLGDGCSQRWFDNSHARDVLGYVPSVTMAAAIRDAVEEYKSLEERAVKAVASRSRG